MLEFKSKDDLQQLDTSNHSFPIVEDLVRRLIVEYAADDWNYDPEAVQVGPPIP